MTLDYHYFMGLFFWWKLTINQLIPRIGRFLSVATDKYEISRMLYGAGFNSSDAYLKTHINDGGTKRSYIEYVLLEGSKSSNLQPFLKLAEMLKEPSYFRNDYKYAYSGTHAKRLSAQINAAVKNDEAIKSAGGSHFTVLKQNFFRTGIMIAGVAGFAASIVTVIQFFE